MMVMDPGATPVGWEEVAPVAGAAALGWKEVALVAVLAAWEEFALVAGVAAWKEVALAAGVAAWKEVALVAGVAAWTRHMWVGLRNCHPRQKPHTNLRFSSVTKASCRQYHGIFFRIVYGIQLFGQYSFLCSSASNNKHLRKS